MITLTMTAVTGSGFDKMILAPIIGNKVVEGRKVQIIFPVLELQKQFKSFFAGWPIEPVVTTTRKAANQEFGIVDADLVILHSLRKNEAEQLIKANPKIEFWVINPIMAGFI